MEHADIPRPNILFLRLAYLVLGALFKVCFRLTCHRDRAALRALGSQPRPVIVVFNHTSHLDVPLVGLCIGLHLMRRVTMPGKKELLEDKRTRWIMQLAGVVPLKRDASDMAAARVLLRALHAGRYVLMSPEGTRSYDGSVQPFKVGFIKLAHKANAIILPVGIAGAARALPRGASFPRPRKITVQVGAPIDPSACLDAQADPAAYDRAAELIRQRIITLSNGDASPSTPGP